MWWIVSSKCGSRLLSSVDNFAVLQLDIVWCYRALEALTCLDDARKRLQRAEDSFLQCYGQEQQRLLLIKVHTRHRAASSHAHTHMLITRVVCVWSGEHGQRGRVVSAPVPPPESPVLHRRERPSGQTTTDQGVFSVWRFSFTASGVILITFN